jgi:murein DD-endopeptidase MepM/ murein hydrolase activator NlpD
MRARQFGRSPRHSLAFGAWKLVALVWLAGGCAESLPELPRSRIRVYTVGDCTLLSWPVDGPLSSPFGRRDGRPHDGIDLAVAAGTPVHAACDGTVAYVGERLRGYGRLVLVQHAGPLVTVYAHNRALLVREGEAVTRGQTIALSGATGRVTAPHLHFEVRQDNRPEDPLKYLAPRVSARRGDWDGRPTGTAHRPHP